MSSNIIELDNRVFEIEATPDSPGVVPRKVALYQLSGPPLTAEEIAHVVGCATELLRDMGIDSFHMEIGETRE